MSVFSQRVTPAWVVQLPAGFFLMFLIQFRSGLRCLICGGMDWRGTFYSLKDLRAGQRVTW